MKVMRGTKYFIIVIGTALMLLGLKTTITVISILMIHKLSGPGKKNKSLNTQKPTLWNSSIMFRPCHLLIITTSKTYRH